MTNQNVELKEGRGTAASLCFDAALTCPSAFGEETNDPVEQDLPPGASVPSAHTQNSHSPTRATPHLSAQGAQAPAKAPSSHTCVPLPSLCLPRFVQN